METRIPLRVYMFVGMGLLAFSFSPILVRLASYAPGLAIAVWRTLWATILLAPVALPRIGSAVRRFHARDGWLIALAGIFLGFHFILWIESLYYTSVASASVLVTTSPLFLAILGYVWLREPVHPRTALAIVLAIGGSFILNWGDLYSLAFPEAWKGNMMALVAALLFSFYLLIGRVVRQRVSWLAYVFPLYTVVALTCLIVAWIQNVPLTGYPVVFYVICMLLAAGPQIMGHGSFNYAVRYIPAAVLGVLSLAEPVLASLLAWVFFNEQPPVPSILGMGIILLAIGLVIYPAQSAVPVQQAGKEGGSAPSEDPKSADGSGGSSQ